MHENEAMDDCWTITHNPLSDYIHFDPIGLLLTSVQDITNDLDFSYTYRLSNMESPRLSQIQRYLISMHTVIQKLYQVEFILLRQNRGKPLGEGFYEVRTATLKSRSFTICTKDTANGSDGIVVHCQSYSVGKCLVVRTASEYSMARAQALQRLQTTWKMLTMWWKKYSVKLFRCTSRSAG